MSMRTKLFSIAVVVLLVLVLTPDVPVATVASQSKSPFYLQSPEADAENVEFVGQIGGTGIRTVTAQGNYAYIGVGPRLVVLDISDPASPTVVGRTIPLRGIVLDIAVDGDYAYVAAEYGGLRVVDISVPTSPVEIGHYNELGYAVGVAVSQGYVYYTGWKVLAVLDVSAPSDPILIGHCYLGDIDADTKGLAVVGSYAYVVGETNNNDGGLWVVDVSEPSNPTEVGFHDTPGSAERVTIAENYAYIADGGEGLRVVDVTTPSDPVEVGHYVNSHPGTGPANAIAIIDDYAYVTFGCSNCNSYYDLVVVDISTPSSPAHRRSLILGGGAIDVAVAEDSAYVVTQEDAYSDFDSLRVLDISSRSSPTKVGTYNYTLGERRVYDVAVAGGYAYATTGGTPSDLWIVDVSTPSDPKNVDLLETDAYICELAVAGSYAYLATTDSLLVVDVSDPTTPREVGSYTTPGWAEDVEVVGSHAYVVGKASYPDDGGWLRVLDISVPSSPSEVGSFDTPGKVYGLAVAGDYAYVADGTEGLRVIDISNPVHPTEVGHVPGHASRVVVSGNYAYVLDCSNDGLRVVNISIPTAPAEMSFYEMGGSLVEIAAGDGDEYVYITDALYNSLRVVDISDPVYPVETGSYCNLSDDPRGVAVDGGYTYVANVHSGLFILRYMKTESSYSVFGRVTDEDDNSIPGVTVSAGFPHAATTDANGNYTITDLVSGTYTLRPDMQGYTFVPPTRTVSVPPDATGVDFMGALSVTVSHIEVTQVIQDEDKGVPLIAGKPTYVRVYVDCGVDCALLLDVKGVLRGYGPSGELPASPIPSVNRSITAYHEEWQDQRDDLHKTLNFTLPPEWCTGTVTLAAELSVVTDSRIVSFQPAQKLQVALIPIQYEPPQWSLCEGRGEPTDRIETAFVWAQQVFPTARIEPVLLPPMPFQEPLCWPWFSSGRNRLFNALLEWSRLKSNNPADYVFGWLPNAAYDGGWAQINIVKETGQNLGGSVAFGDDDPTHGQRIFAHEIAHLLKRPHTRAGERGSCSDPTPDEWSDWPQQYPDAKIQEWGVDGHGFGWLVSSSSALKNPNETYDYMSYCWYKYGVPAWTSPWTYEHIYSETLKSSTTGVATQFASDYQSYFIASGLVYTDDTATLDPVWVLTTTNTPDNPPTGTQYCLEFQDASAIPLVAHCFDLSFLNYETGEAEDADGFSLMLPYSSSVARIVLKTGATEIAVLPVSTRAPVIDILSPNGGEAWAANGTYTVTWTASDADGDTLAYYILYSPNADDWVPIGRTITETHLIVSGAKLAGGNTAKIRVIASDGFNTSTDESDASFAVEGKEPRVHILSPEGDGTVSVGTPLWLQGYAYDLEDGILEGDALHWTSSEDGDLGTGSQKLIVLSQGQHTITLTATDYHGNQATVAITVVVRTSSTATIDKSVTPRGPVSYGDELTYTLVISAPLGTQLGLYDPLESITFERFVEQPEGVTHVDAINDTVYLGGIVTGTLTVTPTNQITVSFVVEVGVPGTLGYTVDVTNRACVYPIGGTLGGCIWSNEVTNLASRPYEIYLPLVMRNP